MLTRNQFCVHKRIHGGEEYFYISDKPSLSTALCIMPSGELFTTNLLRYVELTTDELGTVIEKKDKIEVNKIYDFETFVG